MHGESSAVIALRKALGIAPSPRWVPERSLIDAALDDTKYGSDAARTILRRARERAARLAGPTPQPTTDEIRAALRGTHEQRVRVLARLLIASLEDVITEGEVRPEAEEGGGSKGPPSGLVGDEP